MAAKMTAEVVWQPSAEDGNASMVVVAAKATAEGGGAEGGRRGSGGDCSDSHRIQKVSSNPMSNTEAIGVGTTSPIPSEQVVTRLWSKGAIVKHK